MGGAKLCSVCRRQPGPSGAGRGGGGRGHEDHAADEGLRVGTEQIEGPSEDRAPGVGVEGLDEPGGMGACPSATPPCRRV